MARLLPFGLIWDTTLRKLKNVPRTPNEDELADLVISAYERGDLGLDSKIIMHQHLCCSGLLWLDDTPTGRMVRHVGAISALPIYYSDKLVRLWPYQEFPYPRKYDHVTPNGVGTIGDVWYKLSLIGNRVKELRINKGRVLDDYVCLDYADGLVVAINTYQLVFAGLSSIYYKLRATGGFTVELANFAEAVLVSQDRKTAIVAYQNPNRDWYGNKANFSQEFPSPILVCLGRYLLCEDGTVWYRTKQYERVDSVVLSKAPKSARPIL